MFDTEGVDEFASRMDAERQRQLTKWGDQSYPDGTSTANRPWETDARLACDLAEAAGNLTWLPILREEFAEVAAETDPEKLMAELVQVAAVAQAWYFDIQRRHAPKETS